jgi:Ni/Fe-hydrogenase subunit HybB-like protein
MQRCHPPKKARTSVAILFVMSLLINVGMWSERFMIIVQSLEREYLPSMWSNYGPTWVDIGIFTGTLGFFTLLFMGFLRFVPMISISEMREMKHELVREDAGGNHG